MKRMNYRGRLPGAVSRAAKAVQEVNVLNSGVKHFDSLLKEKGSDQTLHATITNRSLLSDILTGTKKIEIKLKGEIISEDMDGREVLFTTGTDHREKLADIDRERYDFEVPSAKGPIVDHDARYFEKVMITRRDAAEHAILTRALGRAEENIGLIITYFPEYRSQTNLDKITRIIQHEARENPKDYPCLTKEVWEIKTQYEEIGKVVIEACPPEKREEAAKKIAERERAEIRELLQPITAGMGW